MSSPVHVGPTSARWTVVNAREAFPGVITPLTYTFYFPGAEAASGRFWQDLGLLERSAPPAPSNPDRCFFGVFHGRVAINVDRYGEMADRTPGTSAAALEEQMFGVGRGGNGQSGVGGSGTRRRYPHVALRAPATVRRARRDTIRDVALIKAWRRDWLARLDTPAPGAGSAAGPDRTTGPDPDLARRAFREARARLELVLYRHIMLTAVTQGAYEAAGKLAASAGHPGAEVDMVVTRTGTDEAHMVEALRSVAAGHTGMDTFLADYGYHGPNEGHLDGRVWRQEPAPLHALMDRYRRAAERDGRASGAERAAARQRTTDAVLAALPAWRRGPARALLRVAAAMPVLREQGKAQFLQVVDVGRAAATALGDDLARRDRLDTARDVFFLTADELLTDRVDRTAVADRKAAHRNFLTFDLPTAWTGEPTVIPHAAGEGERGGRTAGGTVVTGLGVSSGTATGTVRVVTDPETDGFDVDDVLVCDITDPSWASIMAIAGAIVIDVGGPISHGAIVARELGIPCVVATGDGTRRLRDGDLVVVDGHAGTVTVTSP